jgi:hypothetical protein
MRLSVKVGELEVTVVKALRMSGSHSSVFDVAAAELRAVILCMDQSGFEVVDDATVDSPGNSTVSGDPSTSNVDPPTSNGRVSADRIDYAVGCGKACARLLEGMRADFPPDVGSQRPHFYVLIRDKEGVCPEAGYLVFSRWSEIQPLVQDRHEASGTRTLGHRAIFKGLPSQSEVDSFIRGFQQQQTIFLNSAVRSDDPS